MRWSFAIRRWGSSVEVRLQTLIQKVALSEPSDEHDTRYNISFKPDAINLALYQVTDLFYYRVEDFFDLCCCQYEESRVQSCFFVVGQSWKGDIDLLMFFFVKVTCYELL